ncbi:MAG: hypothetical protein ABII12_07425 [Planctomycetota bacterium]
MRQQWLFWTVVLFAMTALSTPVRAQDRLAAIVTKDKLSRADRALIAAEVPERVKAFASAEGSSKRRTRERDKIIKTARTPNATQAGLDAYVEACGEELGPLAGSDALATALDAANILIELDNANASAALTRGLQSKHAAVRYRAARGLQLLHSRLKGESGKCRDALRALGQAGAVEQNEIVLKKIYEAVNFCTEIPGFAEADASGKALNTIFDRRIGRLASGGRNELADEPGFEAVAACYPSASKGTQRELAQNMAFLLAHGIDRYFDESTTEEYRPTLARLIKKGDDVVRDMIRASNQEAPEQRVGDLIASKSALSAKKPVVEQALADLISVLRGDPWNISAP